jgi:tetratricopeptide (TPR) repeat protein
VAKNKLRKPKAAAYAATGRKLSNSNWVVFIAILISAGLLGSTLVFSLSGSFSGSGTGNNRQTSEGLIKQYQEMLKTNPNDLTTRENLGVEYFNLGTNNLQQQKQAEGQNQLKLAIAEFEKVIEKNPKNAPVLGDLATSYFYTGNTDKAIEDARKALEVDPNLAPARLNLGIYLASKQQYAQAIEELKKVPAGSQQETSAKDMIKQYQELLAAGKK